MRAALTPSDPSRLRAQASSGPALALAKTMGIGKPFRVGILSREQIQGLSPSERIELIELVWETFVEDPETLPETREQRAELRRRLSAHEQDPDSAQPWSKVRTDLERE